MTNPDPDTTTGPTPESNAGSVANRPFLRGMLERTELFSEEQLSALTEEAFPTENGLADIVFRRTGVREADFLVAIARQLDLSFQPLTGVEPSAEVVNCLPARIALQYRVVPLSLTDGVLTIAGNDPFNAGVVDGVRLVCGCPVRLTLSVGDDIAKALRRFYGLGADTVQSMLEDGRFEVEDDLESGKVDINEMGQEASIVRFVNQVIGEADRQGSTDIHFEPMEQELRIRYRIDGVLHKVDVPAQLNRLKAAVISRIKVMAKMDIAEKRMPMDGRIGIRIQGDDLDIRVSTMPTVYGESVSLRLLQKSENFVHLAELGLHDADRRRVEKIIRRPNGILLVTGPTGSGKTTSLYAFLHEINTVGQRILTAEEPIEYEMPGINQVLIRPEIGLTFARVLRSFLRQDPDIIMVGEIRDVETAEIAINASLTGHLVFSTLHTNDAAGAFARLIDMGVEPFLVASAVAAVMAQRLVRRLCRDCRRAGPADPALQSTLATWTRQTDALPATVYHAVGCEICGGTGFRGRGGIFELLRVTDAVESLIINRSSSTQIRQQATQDGMRILREDGCDKVLQGMTTLEEVLRVTEDNP